MKGSTHYVHVCDVPCSLDWRKECTALVPVAPKTMGGVYDQHMDEEGSYHVRLGGRVSNDGFGKQ